MAKRSEEKPMAEQQPKPNAGPTVIDVETVRRDADEALQAADTEPLRAEEASKEGPEDSGFPEAGCDETVMVQGEVNVTVSQGSKADAVENKPESSANPHTETIPKEPRDFMKGRYSKVSVNYGITMSLGNYEFAKIDIGMEDFCEATPASRKQACRDLSKEASAFLFSAAKNVKQYLDEKRGGLGF